MASEAKTLEWINSAKQSAKEVADIFESLATNFEQKLWFQFTLDLENLFQHKYFSSSSKVSLVSIFENVVAPYASNLDLLIVAKLLNASAKQINNDKEALEFIEKHKELIVDEAASNLLINGAITYYTAKLGQLNTAEVKCEEMEALVKNTKSVFPSAALVSVYKACGLVAKLQNKTADHAQYYLNELCYEDISTFSPAEREAAAVTLLTALILSPQHYSYKLNHPILESMDPKLPIMTLVYALNYGDHAQFFAILDNKTLPKDIQASKLFLTAKFRTIKMLLLIHSKKFNERVATIQELEQVLQCKPIEVHQTILFACNLNIIQAEIDELNQRVQFTRMVPRELDTAQLNALADSFGLAVQNMQSLVALSAKSVQTHQLAPQ